MTTGIHGAEDRKIYGMILLENGILHKQDPKENIHTISVLI